MIKEANRKDQIEIFTNGVLFIKKEKFTIADIILFLKEDYPNINSKQVYYLLNQTLLKTEITEKAGTVTKTTSKNRKGAKLFKRGPEAKRILKERRQASPQEAEKVKVEDNKKTTNINTKEFVGEFLRVLKAAEQERDDLKESSLQTADKISKSKELILETSSDLDKEVDFFEAVTLLTEKLSSSEDSENELQASKEELAKVRTELAKIKEENDGLQTSIDEGKSVEVIIPSSFGLDNQAN